MAKTRNDTLLARGLFWAVLLQIAICSGASAQTKERTYTVSPSGVQQGKEYELIIKSVNCTSNDLRGADLDAPLGSGITVENAVGINDCTMLARIVVAQDAPVDTAVLRVTKQGSVWGLLDLPVRRSLTPQPSPQSNIANLSLSPNGYPTEIGVYARIGKQWIEIQPEVINWKTGGVVKRLATLGIVQGDLNGHLNGRSSRNKLNTPLEFCIYAPEGVAITEYQLLKLRYHGQKEYREFRTVTGGVFHVKGGATRDLLEFEGRKVASRTFVITVSLGHGEYGFLPPGAFTSASSSSTLGKMYTFRVLE